MPRVAYPNEVGIRDPDIIEVRISTAMTRRTGKGPGGKNVPTDHILKVRHRSFGWIKPWEWGALSKIEGVIKDIGPLKMVAWVGLTITYSETIKAAPDFIDWAKSLSGEIGNFFSQIGAAIFGAGLPETTAQVGAAFGGAGSAVQGFVTAVQAFLLPKGAIAQYFWAAVAAAITVLGLSNVSLSVG